MSTPPNLRAPVDGEIARSVPLSGASSRRSCYSRLSAARGWRPLVTALFAMVLGRRRHGDHLIANQLVEFTLSHWQRRLTPIVFVLPAIAFVVYFLALPAVRTFIASLFDRDGSNSPSALQLHTVRPLNCSCWSPSATTVLWIVFGASFTIIFGLLVAALADRSNWRISPRRSSSCRWRSRWSGPADRKFIYAVRDPSDVQIGLLNAIVVALGGEPRPGSPCCSLGTTCS